MGFCLFQHIKNRNIYFAVNPAYVAAVTALDNDAAGRSVCRIEMNHPAAGFDPVAVGEKAAIEAVLKEAAKIGFNKTNIKILAGSRKRAQSYLMSNTHHVVLVRELSADEIGQSEDMIVTASEFYVDGEAPRQMVERPGVFAMRVNADGKVPRL